MKMKMKKITLVGLGAMGSFFAPRLSETFGDGFRILADGVRKTRLEEKGVTINGRTWKFPVVTPEEKGDPADLILVAVKGYSLNQAIADMRNQVGEHTLILAVLNGVNSETDMIAAFGASHVLYSYMRVSIVMKDGVTDFDPDKGLVHFGEKRNAGTDYSERVLAVKEVFDAAQIPYAIDPDMEKGLWFKYMCNVGENMTCALLGIPFGGFRVSEYANAIRIAAMREVLAIAQKKGIDLSQADIDRQEETLKKLPYQNKPSTLQDLEAGKHTEVDMFAGQVIRMGEELGIDTPVCRFFYDGIHVLEQKNDGTLSGPAFCRSA